MTKNNSIDNDNINFFHLFQILWAGKFIIAMFVLVSFISGLGLIYTKNDIHVSNINFKVYYMPPFFTSTMAFKDFKKMFYNKDIFSSWKKNNIKSELDYEEFSNTKKVKGFIFSKGKGENLVEFSKEHNNSFELTIYSNKFSTLDEFFNYSTYINNLLKEEYVSRAKSELNIIETRFDDFSTANDQIITNLLKVDRFIASMQKGSQLINIGRPTQCQH